jgi:hypothetical protein
MVSDLASAAKIFVDPAADRVNGSRSWRVQGIEKRPESRGHARTHLPEKIMRNLHRALMGVTFVAVLAVSVTMIQPWALAAVTQHGDGAGAQHGHQAAGPEDHFSAMAAELELSAEQQHALAEPFAEAFAAMEQLQHLHEVIAEQLTEAQQEKFAEMVHVMMGAAMSGHGH